MAQLFPSLENINKLRVQPTDGERHLLEFLNNTLDDSYEIYFQPYLNGDNPDIILMRENSGVMIIEVKDFNLDKYELNEKTNWVTKNVTNRIGKKQVIKSPIRQVFEYKENLYNLHIDTLLEKKIKDYRYLYIVTCAVYFHNASSAEINNFLTDGFEEKQSYLKFLNHFEIWGRDTLDPKQIKNIFFERRLSRKSYLFDEELYKSFKLYLKPPMHLIEQGKDITYTDEQQRVIFSKEGAKQKVKGVAGSGKTMALAKRAVNSHLRTGKRVLILTFNISLRNYIKDKLNEVRENFAWKNFEILHYHQFIKSHNNNEGFVPDAEEQTRSGAAKYDSIIIDEVQDYQKEWISNVRQFLSENGEFVCFGDEKQNIYQRELEDKKPYTGIGGQWNILKKSFRVSSKIANLASQYQRAFFTDKYDYDEIIVQRSMFDNSNVHYHFFKEGDLEGILSLYQELVKQHEIHDNDVCFQSSKVDILRLIDQQIRTGLKKKTNTMFETQEVYEKLEQDNTKDGKLNEESFKKEIDKVRRFKKFNFYMNSGTIKLSTIHSFKGWEIDTLFLLIENEKEDNRKEEFTTEELIYTAITRCRNNLVIVNIANEHYHRFLIQ